VKCAICNKPITQKQSREIRKIVEAGKVIKVENRHTKPADCPVLAEKEERIERIMDIARIL